MTKAKKPRRMARPVAAISSGQVELHSAASAELSTPTAKSPTKQDLVLDLMRGEGGASLTAIVEVTGWLPHTARAALTGLRKKGHVIEKSKVDGETRYAITAGLAQ